MNAFPGDRGGVAFVFALAALPLLLAVGLVVDHVRAAGAQERLADAARAAAFAARAEPDRDAREAVALRYLAANLPADIATLIKNVAIEEGDRGGLRVAVDAEMPTTLGRLAGVDMMRVDAVYVLEDGGPLTGREFAIAYDPAMPLESSARRAAFEQELTGLARTLAQRGGRVALAPYGEAINIRVDAADYWRQWLERAPPVDWSGCVEQRRQTPSARYKPYSPFEKPFRPALTGRCAAPARGLDADPSAIADAVAASFAQTAMTALDAEAAGDSGLAWAYRALADEWIDAWPRAIAPDPDAEKTVLLILDGRAPPNIGESAPSTEPGLEPVVIHATADIAFGQVCRHLRPFDVDLHVLWFGPRADHASRLERCVYDSENFHEAPDLEALRRALAFDIPKRFTEAASGSRSADDD